MHEKGDSKIINNDNRFTGLDSLSAESKAQFLTRVWYTTSHEMCLAQMVFDADGAPVDYLILDINPAYEKSLGLTRDQVINKLLTERFPNYDPSWVDKCGEAVLSGKILSTVESIPARDAFYKVEIIPLDVKDQFLIVCEDITQQKKAEDALHQAKEELKEALILAEQKTAELDAAFEAVPDGLTVYDKNSNIIYMNDTIKKFYKRFEENLGDYFTGNQQIRMERLKISYPDGRPLIPEDTPLYRAINYGETVKDYVTLAQIGDDNEIYSSGSCAPIRNNLGEIIGAVMLHYDITKRIELEKETEQLIEKLRRADQNKNVFINMLSHELRNPLASIMTSLEFLEQALPGGEEIRNSYGDSQTSM